MNVDSQALEQRVKFLEAALSEIFDVAVPEAMPWMNSESEKATYAARVLPEQIRGRYRLSDAAHKKVEALTSWIKAANQFAWAHEQECPRGEDKGDCTCGLDQFLGRPSRFIESYKNEIEKLEISNRDAGRLLNEMNWALADSERANGCDHSCPKWPFVVGAAIGLVASYIWNGRE